MVQQSFSSQTVNHIAQLANIPVTADEEKMLAKSFTETIEVVAKMSQLNTSQTSPTHQVTGLENAWRDDEITPDRSFTQSQALANAADVHDGFFVVAQIIDQDDWYVKWTNAQTSIGSSGG